MNSTKTAIRRVLNREKTLNYLGIGHYAIQNSCGDKDRELLLESIEEVDAAMDWLSCASMYRRKTINQVHSSYGLKYLAEKFTGKYISNGAFITAAIILGFRYEICGHGPSCLFNIHEKFINKSWNDIMTK